MLHEIRSLKFEVDPIMCITLHTIDNWFLNCEKLTIFYSSKWQIVQLYRAGKSCKIMVGIPTHKISVRGILFFARNTQTFEHFKNQITKNNLLSNEG